MIWRRGHPLRSPPRPWKHPSCTTDAAPGVGLGSWVPQQVLRCLKKRAAAAREWGRRSSPSSPAETLHHQVAGSPPCFHCCAVAVPCSLTARSARQGSCMPSAGRLEPALREGPQASAQTRMKHCLAGIHVHAVSWTALRLPYTRCNRQTRPITPACSPPEGAQLLVWNSAVARCRVDCSGMARCSALSCWGAMRPAAAVLRARWLPRAAQPPTPPPGHLRNPHPQFLPQLKQGLVLDGRLSKGR